MDGDGNYGDSLSAGYHGSIQESKNEDDKDGHQGPMQDFGKMDTQQQQWPIPIKLPREDVDLVQLIISQHSVSFIAPPSFLSFSPPRHQHLQRSKPVL